MIRPSHNLRKRYPTLLLMLALGCGKSEVKATSVLDQDRSKPSYPPTAAQIISATAPGYISPTGVKQECLGRLVFDVDGGHDWPTFFDGNGSIDRTSKFSQTVGSGGGEIIFGNVKIMVYGTLDKKKLELLKIYTPTGKLDAHWEVIKGDNQAIKSLKKEKLSSDKLNYLINNLNDSIKRRMTSIEEINKKFRSFDPGLPESLGYTWDEQASSGADRFYSMYMAHVMRNNYAYIFESTAELSPTMSKEQHKKQFIEMLSRFRPRKDNEIPTDLGICIPVGFIADDGRTFIDINQSLRWKDAPGVIYNIHTGTADRRHDKTPLLTAISTAAVGRLGSDDDKEIKNFVTERIGPRSYFIGGLKGSQGGVAVKFTNRGAQPVETYNVFTGYPGWWGVDALPYILVEMSTLTVAQSKELKQDPPPFKQSMARLEPLLKSIRLRPTNPLMPDLANLPAK